MPKTGSVHAGRSWFLLKLSKVYSVNGLPTPPHTGSQTKMPYPREFIVRGTNRSILIDHTDGIQLLILSYEGVLIICYIAIFHKCFNTTGECLCRMIPLSYTCTSIFSQNYLRSLEYGAATHDDLWYAWGNVSATTLTIKS